MNKEKDKNLDSRQKDFLRAFGSSSLCPTRKICIFAHT